MRKPPYGVAGQSRFDGFTEPPSKPSRPRHAAFFALRPSPGAAAQIVTLRDRLMQAYGLERRPISIARLHLTLLPIIADDDPPPAMLIAAACKAAATVAAAPFDIALDRVESFDIPRQHRPLVLAAQTRPATLLALHRRLHGAILSAGLHPPRYSFARPHVTMMWDRAIPSSFGIAPIGLHAREIVFIHSHVGQSRHETLGRWLLEGGDGAQEPA